MYLYELYIYICINTYISILRSHFGSRQTRPLVRLEDDIAFWVGFPAQTDNQLSFQSPICPSARARYLAVFHISGSGLA